MSTVARGGSRGGRGRGAGTAVWRGSNTRGGLNGASSDASDRPASGAKKRGGGAPAGGKTRSNAQDLDEHGSPKNVPFVPMNRYGTAANSTPHAKDDYSRRFDYLQKAQPSWRKQLQDKGLMNPDGQMKLEDSVKLIGLCTDMCPEYERVRRIHQNDYKRPECTPDTQHLAYADRVPDESRMVKAFTRSSAGADVELVIDIRDPATCLKTVKYLSARLDTEGFDHLHAWIWDRTRSVRKDLRTQVVEKPTDIRTLLVCLEASARFYLLSMHQMAQTAKEDYSHQQDMEQFNQTLTTLRERYDDNRRAGIPSENEAEFVAYRLILASLYANSQLENELHSLPNDLRNNKRVLTAIDLFKAAKSAFYFGPDKSWIQAQANWTKFWALIRSPSVSYLMACAAEVGFNRVRHVILDSIWHAYRRGSKGDVDVQAWTTDKLKHVLAMDDDKDAVKLCELFGFHFERNAEGRTYLDISKLGNGNRSLGVPHTIKPQMFSQGLVESKRHNRAFSAIIQGMTVQQAKTNGLLVDPSTIRSGGEDSLFIPETTTAPKPNVFGQRTNGATTNGTSNFNPFASQPSSQPSSGSSTPNPFGGNPTPPVQPAQAVPAPAFGQGAFSNTFNAAKDPIKFAPTPASGTNDNPFAKAAAALPPQSTVPPSTPPGSFKFGTNAALAPQGQPSTTQTTPAFGVANDQPASAAGKPFVFPGSSELDAKIKSGERSGASATPAGSPPQPDAAAEATAKEKAEADARAAVLKQKQEAEERRKREQEEQERTAREAHQAREAEKRRIEEEKQRQLREQQLKELRAKQERERLIQEEQQRRQQEEQDRLARMRRRETAYNALTSNIVFSGEEGLLYQFLENTVKNVAEKGYKEWQAELRLKREAEEKDMKRKAFARAVFTHWIAQVQKKKRNARAKERRKRLKAQREQSINGEGETASEAPTAESVASTDQANGVSSARSAPVNDRRARRTQERRASAAADQVTQSTTSAQQRAASSQQTQNMTASATMTNGHHARSYSEAYHKSTVPIDRTETDWFKLRAMGIDPSKHRKRSFDSATDEDKEDAEAKRVRRSDSDASLITQQPPEPEAPSKPLTIEERLARIRAAKQSFRTSGSGSPPVNGASPSKRSSLTGRASLIIAQARDLIAKSPTAKQSPVTVHDFGRSVPNLSVSTSSFRQSALGKSVGATQSNKPAYWGRASRFVPQHLYGKGPEAIREYRDKYVNSPTSTPRPLSTEPLALSSPIPTQFSYIPQPGYSENGSASGVDLVDVNAEDNVAGDTEEDSFDGDDEEIEHDEEQEDEDEEDDDPTQFDAYAEEYDEEEECTEEEDQHFAQRGSSFGASIGPGATQDDAIELSD